MSKSANHGHAGEKLDERRAKGTEWRKQVPFAAQAEWKPPSSRADPVELLIEQGKSRIQELLPVRYARMKADPFAFLRGAAAIMAADLGAGASTGLRLRACGDCHLANFGGYASPEGILVFDVNDFDETLPAPFEWDVKRLATSLAVANRVPVVGGPGGDGWFKMFEFFEVPSQMTGAIGPVAQGANFDWARQDSKPGLMNINLIADEEAFFSIFGSQDAS